MTASLVADPAGATDSTNYPVAPARLLSGAVKDGSRTITWCNPLTSFPGETGWTKRKGAARDVQTWDGPDGARVTVRPVSAWWGHDVPPDAHTTRLGLLRGVLATAGWKNPRILDTPTATGTVLLNRCSTHPATQHDDAWRATPQHRFELFPEPRLEGFHHAARDLAVPAVQYDARVAYLACLRELGTAEGERRDHGEPITDPDLRKRYGVPAGHDGSGVIPYARARYRARIRIPARRHETRVGVVAKPSPDGRSWTWPNTTGDEWETWVDGSDADLAVRAGWQLDVKERVLLAKARSVDTWADRLIRAVEAVTFDSAQAVNDVRACLRSIALRTIGSWHSLGAIATHETPDARAIPDDALPESVVYDDERDVWQYARRGSSAGGHPEWSCGVWGRARARVLWTPPARDGSIPATGALAPLRGHLIGIRGDAVWVTAHQASWVDDGRIGRLRLKEDRVLARWPRSWSDDEWQPTGGATTTREAAPA